MMKLLATILMLCTVGCVNSPANVDKECLEECRMQRYDCMYSSTYCNEQRQNCEAECK